MRLILYFSRFTCGCLKLVNDCHNLQLRVDQIHQLCYSGTISWTSVNQYRTLYSSCCTLRADKIDTLKLDGKPPEKKKKLLKLYITLIGTDNSVSVLPIEDADKIAKRRNLKLVKIKDFEAKTERPTYQLMSSVQYMEETKQKVSKPGSKQPKILTLSSKITDNDLNNKIKSIQKWIQKQHEIRIAISDDNGEAENVFKKIENEIKDKGRVVQKRTKGHILKFDILPPKAPKKSDVSEVPSSTNEE